MEEIKMEYIYAAMLLHKAGKEITAAAVKAVLSAAGVSVDETRVKALVAALEARRHRRSSQKSSHRYCSCCSSGCIRRSACWRREKEKKEDNKKAEESAAAGLGALFG